MELQASPKACISQPLKIRRFMDGLFNVSPIGEYLKLAQANSAQSPLLRLPAELRNKIFEYALTYETQEVSHNGCLRTKARHCLSLHRVCGQTYNETALMFMKNTLFSFCFGSHLRLWALSRPKAQREAVTELMLRCSLYWIGQFGQFRKKLCLGLGLLPNIKKVHLIVRYPSHISDIIKNEKSSDIVGPLCEDIKGAGLYVELFIVWEKF
ncbi:hypothetical protein P154DRAFT_524797 [Amniculicola lignicola CBS 123094]|uniref:F-box domain-containing protein n=1 Tax=Amniculicola lignicola CBS 123094 TaxID=1392246 RepID=A0A6A5WIG7_9PLEO|nr:hypothetical protein P154DRAFT_524797 [Amniculicola lignicola CBS 123094]